MSELLIEIFTEEIPARMQLKAATDFKAAFEASFNDYDLCYSSIKTYVTPRRLTLITEGLATETVATTEERRGPRVGAPDAALAGFLKSTGVTKEQCIQKDNYWYASINQEAKKTASLIPTIFRTIIKNFSWAKSMRWPGATLPWVRPVRSVLCLFDQETLSFDVPEFGLESSNKTYGHRFLAPIELTILSFADYKEQLKNAFVILDHTQRQNLIKDELQKLAIEKGYEVEPDIALLQEVSGLVEYPQPMVGQINKEFMCLPKPVLSTSMRVHQKYFTFVDALGNIAPYFGFVANTVSTDNGKEMLRGYERVLGARLSDAAFFYEHDCKIPLENLVPALNKIIFHAKLGTLGDRVQRFIELVDSAEAKKAALLCKTDLVSSMVGEFPELQGIMGGIYAKTQGESPTISCAIEQHYQPAGLNDFCPTDPVAIELALAEKIDVLVGFFGIGEIPTGSKDPFALRRAALGVIRIIRENHLNNFNLKEKLTKAYNLYCKQGINFIKNFQVQDVVDFILERLSHALRAENVRHDCITAVLKADKADENICSVADRAIALDNFLKSDSGISLQVAFKRAQGILAKSNINLTSYSLNLNELKDPAEQNLLSHLNILSDKAPQLLTAREYKKMMQILADLRPIVDDFFTLKINDDNEAIRLNRFALLQRLTNQTKVIADFNHLEG